MTELALSVAHQSKGRVRLRRTAPTREPASWEELVVRLTGCPLVHNVTIRPVTGSIVVEHTGELAELLRWADEHDVFTAAARPSSTRDPLYRIAKALEAANERALRSADGDLDLRVVAFYGLIGATAVQLARGQVLPAAETLFAHAMALLPRLRAQ